ncbi:hypothetical protein ANN_09092 [Periplaneta americana]|uniref:C2H2-type domain-containing protein n=1 Tax=Periplaneta americana TaxID=6978 RepID=A0ABQ8TMY3_PERAM|nr:hypothetical protein ANN_09092 [Periplaneta americana]
MDLVKDEPTETEDDDAWKNVHKEMVMTESLPDVSRDPVLPKGNMVTVKVEAEDADSSGEVEHDMIPHSPIMCDTEPIVKTEIKPMKTADPLSGFNSEENFEYVSIPTVKTEIKEECSDSSEAEVNLKNEVTAEEETIVGTENYILPRHLEDQITKYNIHGEEFMRKLDSVIQRHTNKPHTPLVTELKTKRNLVRHLHIHSGVSFKCKICGKAYTTKRYLMRHLYIHGGEKPFVCNACGKAFRTRAALVRHEGIHSRGKPFTCNICKKSFALRCYLDLHKRWHTGELPFKCDTCGKRYPNRPILQIHIQSHIAEKPYKCKFCLRKFVSKLLLATHERFHKGENPFKCDVCRSGFKTNAIRLAHKLSHKKQRPFSCRICGKWYSSNVKLVRHFALHSVRKPHKCGICGKSFSRKKGLSLHNQLHKGGKSNSFIKQNMNC